jgi:uroporphyrin-III C-methyltransferase/precorrin-2 dehydrogenase/sirohydrochlorin ferrochelatase
MPPPEDDPSGGFVFGADSMSSQLPQPEKSSSGQNGAGPGSSARADVARAGVKEHLLALFLKLEGRGCVVVGGGSIAEGKVRALLASGAVVTVIAPEVTSQIVAWSTTERLSWEQHEFRTSDLEDAFLVIGATDNRELNAGIFAAAEARGILCNAVDDPEHCHFYFPSVVDRGPLQIAISTTGYSPALAQRLRRELEKLYGEEYAGWVRQLGAYRFRLFQDANIDPETRRELLHREASDESFRGFVNHQQNTPTQAKTGLPPQQAQQRRPLGARLEWGAEEEPVRNASGKVYLVGAGPGDPELLTVKAVRVLQAADVVLHDDLVGPEILDMIPAHAEVRAVGKRAGGRHTPQAEINELLLTYARAGKRVVRLKGGDPLLFGRAGEEMEALRAAGIRFEVVPGVTAALGAAATAKIPLTDRRLASSVLFASGHACAGNAVTDWAAAVQTGATLVIYMPGNHQEMAASLLATGLDGETPCAVISQASLPGEHIACNSLRQLSQAANPAKPNLLIVGAVAAVMQDGIKTASSALKTDSNLQELATR